jgi:hypothetical protein
LQKTNRGKQIKLDSIREMISSAAQQEEDRWRIRIKITETSAHEHIASAILQSSYEEKETSATHQLNTPRLSDNIRPAALA